jgi:hypothetical protein
MKGRVIGVTTRGEFKSEQGRVFPPSATFYVIRKNRGDNSFGDIGDEVKIPSSHSTYQDLLLGTDDFRHCIGAVIDYSFTVKNDYKRLEDVILVSYINSDGEKIEYNEGDDGPPLWKSNQKIKASA